MSTQDKKFWEKVEKSHSQTACWLWRGAKDRDGYGRVMRVQFSKTPLKAHRYAFYLHYRRWPEGVCSPACGNKACVRPGHLYDDVRLAEKAKPVVNGYLEDCARQIQERYVKGSRVNGVRGLAEDYGLDTNLVREIVSGKFEEYVRKIAAEQEFFHFYKSIVKEAKNAVNP